MSNDATARVPSARDRGKLRELERSLIVDREGQSVLERVVPELPWLLGTSAVVAYSLTREQDRVGVDACVVHGVDAAFAGALDELLVRVPLRFGVFNPVRPEPTQRNVPMGRELLALRRHIPLYHEVFHRFGLTAMGGLRTLVCDGAALLCNLCTMFPYEPGHRERQLLSELVPTLQQRLRAERLLNQGSLATAAIGGALESIPSASFVLDGRGRLAHANAAGRAAFDRDPKALREALASSLAHPDGPFVVTPLAGGGSLVVERSAPSDPEPRLACMARVLSLTPRQRQVLGMLVRGAANKTIAATLGCAEATVEVHVTALLKKAQCEGRAALVAKFWST